MVFLRSRWLWKQLSATSTLANFRKAACWVPAEAKVNLLKHTEAGMASCGLAASGMGRRGRRQDVEHDAAQVHGPRRINNKKRTRHIFFKHE